MKTYEVELAESTVTVDVVRWTSLLRISQSVKVNPGYYMPRLSNSSFRNYLTLRFSITWVV